MSYQRHRSFDHRTSFLSTMRTGINRFQQLKFSTSVRKNNLRTQTDPDTEEHHELQNMLRTKRQRCKEIKIQLKRQRELQLTDFVKKSIKYQQLLDINDNKKKRLPTLNSKVGQIIKISAYQQQLIKKIQYSLQTNYIPVDSAKPQAREGHSTIMYHNNAVVIGGHCSAPYPFGHVFSFSTLSWIKQFPLPSARSYHSTVLYKNRYAIVFGGMGSYDVSRKCRICYNTVNLIDLHSQHGRVLKMGSEQLIQGRRSHAYGLMGKYMLIFGGINTKREFLRDFAYLDLKELRWYHKQYRIEGKDLIQDMRLGIAKHKAVLNFKQSRKTLPLYSLDYSDTQGIYFFGGAFGNGNENILSYIAVNTYNPYLKRLAFTGTPPSSSNTSAQKVNQNLIFIISGQANDRMAKLFKIKQRQFVGIYNYPNTPYLGGVGSSMNIYPAGLLILFGLTQNGYSSDVVSLKLQEKCKWQQLQGKKSRKDSGQEWRLWNKTSITNNSNDSD